MANYCAPHRQDNYNKYKTCFTFNALQRIADKLNVSSSGSRKDIQNRIQDKFSDMCKGDEYCIIEQNDLLNSNEALDAFKPEHPSDNKYEC